MKHTIFFLTTIVLILSLPGQVLAVTLLSEDFNDGVADGFNVAGGSWAVTDGEYVQSSTGGIPLSWVDAGDLGEYTIEVDIAPPDTRIIIPRINQNVPIVPVPEEKLFARNWDNLEKDIQESEKEVKDLL